MTYDWPTTLKDASRKLHAAPWPDTEAAVLQFFIEDPQRVIDAVNELAAELERGQAVRSPWAVLRKRLAHQPASVQVDSSSPGQAVKRAERLIRNIGCAMDDELELAEHLYGPGQPLHGRSEDEQLWQRMVTLWQTRRGAA